MNQYYGPYNVKCSALEFAGSALLELSLQYFEQFRLFSSGIVSLRYKYTLHQKKVTFSS